MCRSQECAIYNVFVYTGTIYSVPRERERERERCIMMTVMLCLAMTSLLCTCPFGCFIFYLEVIIVSIDWNSQNVKL